MISGNKGRDVAIGGTAGDTIYGDDAGASAGGRRPRRHAARRQRRHLPRSPTARRPGGDLKLVLDAAVKTIRTTDEEHPRVRRRRHDLRQRRGDIIAGGVQGDTLYGDRATDATTDALDGNDIILGDNGALEWLSTGRLAEIIGIDIAANNPALFAKYGAAWPTPTSPRST